MNAPAESGSASPRGRVLVVDDDLALAEMLGIVLRQEGFTPYFWGDGAKALDAFHAVAPDVVLLDVMLPGMNGIAICRAIRTESGVPIVMLTARTDTTEVVEGLESGADDYIVKPFKPKELVARLRVRVRHVEIIPAAELAIGDLVIDVNRSTLADYNLKQLIVSCLQSPSTTKIESALNSFCESVPYTSP